MNGLFIQKGYDPHYSPFQLEDYTPEPKAIVFLRFQGWPPLCNKENPVISQQYLAFARKKEASS